MKLLLTVLFSAATHFAFSQILNVKEAAKRKTENKVNNKTDEGIEKGLNKVEEGIGNLFKKKKKKTQAEESESSTTGSSDKKVEQSATSVTLKAYSKFDFVPGDKIIYYEDFSHVDVGDFPANFNTNASGEVVAVDGKQGKWLNLTKNGAFVPEGVGSTLPENFTLEMNVGIIDDPSNNMSGFGLNFNTEKDKLLNYMFSYGSFV
ncbi:MAG TPA: hypothetical protein PK504_03305, partial [Ferruginibacter sp.]|nr:hypothetical protein [Ferruginibacter sp.]